MALRVSGWLSLSRISYGRRRRRGIPPRWHPGLPRAGRFPAAKDFADAVSCAEAIEAGFREDDRIVFAAFYFAEAGIYVARGGRESRGRGATWRSCARRRRLPVPMRAPWRKLRVWRHSGDETVANVGALADRRKREAGRIRWGCLSRCGRRCRFFVEQRVFEFLDEDSLPTDLESEALRNLSPEVLMITISVSTPAS